MWVMVCIYEREIDTQNAKMSGLNPHKEENVGFVSNLTSDCVLILISFWFYLKNIYYCSSVLKYFVQVLID